MHVLREWARMSIKASLSAPKVAIQDEWRTIHHAAQANDIIRSVPVT